MTGDHYKANTAPSQQSRVGSYLFPCPKCDGPTLVKDCRNVNYKKGKPLSYSARRRRSCVACGWRFSTVEVQGRDLDQHYHSSMSKVIALLISRLEQMVP